MLLKISNHMVDYIDIFSVATTCIPNVTQSTSRCFLFNHFGLNRTQLNLKAITTNHNHIINQTQLE